MGRCRCRRSLPGKLRRERMIPAAMKREVQRWWQSLSREERIEVCRQIFAGKRSSVVRDFFVTEDLYGEAECLIIHLPSTMLRGSARSFDLSPDLVTPSRAWCFSTIGRKFFFATQRNLFEFTDTSTAAIRE